VNDSPAVVADCETEAGVTHEARLDDRGDVVVDNADPELPTDNAEPMQPASVDMLSGEDSQLADNNMASTNNA